MPYDMKAKIKLFNAKKNYKPYGMESSKYIQISS
jgi:hypothetical protein